MKKASFSFAVLFMALMLLPTIAPAQSKEEAGRLFDEAIKLAQNAQSNQDLVTAVQKYEQAMKIFEKVGDRRMVGVCANNAAILYKDWGQYKKAVDSYEKSLAIKREQADRQGEGITLNNLGNVYMDWGQYDKAVEHYKKALTIARDLKSPSNQIYPLNNLGLVYADWGRYETAVDYHEKSLAICRELKDRRGEARSLNNLGVLYKDWGRYDKAVDYHEKSLAICRELKDRRGQGQSLNNLGEVYRERGQYEKALECYEKDLAICREFKDRKGEGKTLNNMGLVYSNWGEYDKAVAYFEKSLAIKKELKDPDGEGKTLNNLGNVYKDKGEYDKAVECYEKSLAIKRNLKDPKGEGETLNNLGLVYASRGEYDKAAEFYEKDLAICRNLKDQACEGAPLNNLGNVHKNRGQYAKAVECYEKTLQIARELKAPSRQVNPLNNLGLIYAELGDYDKAVEYYEKSLAIKREIRDRYGEGQTLMNIGQVLQHHREKQKALDNFQKGLAIWNGIKVPTRWPKALIADLYMDSGDLSKAEPLLTEANYNNRWGRFYLLKSDFHKAKDYYEKIQKSAEESRDVEGLFTAYTGLGRVHEGLEDYNKAVEYYEKGMQLTEEIRSSLLPSERKNFLEVKINGFYRSEPAQGLTRVRLKLNRAADSIDSSEATRARAFSDKISQRSETGQADMPRDILEREDDLVTKVAALKKELGKTDRGKQTERFQALEKQVRDSETELKAFVEMLWERYKPYAAVKYPRPVTLKESDLKLDEWAIVFDTSGEGVGVKLIKGKEIEQTYYYKWKSEDLEKDVKSFRLSFEQADLEAFDSELGKALYKRLLAATLMHVPEGAPLTIIPDGILAVLPFEALVVSGNAEWKQGPLGQQMAGLTYLADLHPISYYQSITALTLARTMSSAKKPGEKLLVVADPVFELNDRRAQAIPEKAVASKDGEYMVNLMASIENSSGGSFKFKRLPETSMLASNLSRLYGTKCDTYTDLKATKRQFFENVAPKLDQYRYIVFATHGVFSDKIPGLLEPFLALTMVPPGTDGFLKMSDVMGLSMNADVVALTACQTGLGRELSGEGVMSIGRAFQYAGARSVLMSLWSVAEKSSVQLMEVFFKNLKEGKNRLEALRLAREEIRKNGHDHPFFWAPFILVGEVN